MNIGDAILASTIVACATYIINNLVGWFYFVPRREQHKFELDLELYGRKAEIDMSKLVSTWSLHGKDKA